MGDRFDRSEFADLKIFRSEGEWYSNGTESDREWSIGRTCVERPEASRDHTNQRKGTDSVKSPHVIKKRLGRLAVLVIGLLLTVGITAAPAGATSSQSAQHPKIDVAAVKLAPQAQPLAANRYGAIAHSPSTLAANSAVSNVSENDARGNALYKCNQMISARDCRVDVSFTNFWGALAVSTPNGPFGTGVAGDHNSAIGYAVNWCRAYGGGDSCRAIVWINATYVP